MPVALPKEKTEAAAEHRGNGGDAEQGKWRGNFKSDCCGQDGFDGNGLDEGFGGGEKEEKPQSVLQHLFFGPGDEGGHHGCMCNKKATLVWHI